MAIYTQKCEQKWLKINNSGWGGVGGWNKDVLGGKKSKNLQSGGGERLFGTREYVTNLSLLEILSSAVKASMTPPSKRIWNILTCH